MATYALLPGQRNRRLPVVDYPTDAPPRPRTRGECVDGERPCPWVSCRWHLRINLTRKGRVQVDTREEMPETCALDIADRGEHTLEEVGTYLGMTRERVRQVEEVALAKMREHEKELR